MKFTLAPEQHSFFKKKKLIEFEEIWSADELHLLKNRSEELLAKRLNVEPEKLARASNLDLYRAGRDLWKEEDKFRKALFPKKLLQAARELYQTETLRLGFSQHLFAGLDRKSPLGDVARTLKESVSFSEILGSALLSLNQGTAAADQSAKFCPFPEKEGNLIFLSPDLVFSTELLFSDPGQHHILFLFSPLKTLYLFQEKDPLTHLLKKSGYAFGDSLKDETHPVLQ
jgi:hypothetical protein